MSYERSCCCGQGSHTPTGELHYCMKHGRWSDDPRDRPTGTPKFYHNPGLFADFVIGDIGLSCSTWMVPGTYDAEADAPPPPPKVIATLLGYPFDVDSWLIQLGDQWYDAAVLRMFAQIMDDTNEVRQPHKWDGWRH
jgi:hypothetical protein